MFDLKFDNRFVSELPGDPRTGRETRQVEHACFSRVLPTPVAAPRLIAVQEELAARIGFTEADWKSPEFAQVFGGNTTLPGMDPFAACYGGHQFGNWAGQLGDGRAISLGEVVNAQGERFELQLKGAGPTPYSRRADGRAVLRSSIREFLCSEAMHHLGVPTTRALSLVATGDLVERDMFYDGNAKLEPGAIVCRVSPSFIRFGNFELPSVRGDIELLTKLVDFTIDRDYRLEGSVEERRERWFDEICTRTAKMIVHWMRVGFVHGVMNTDNMSILGLTIDYGPYGWLDDFDPSFTPNTTDSRNRRYRFGAQPTIAQWNLVRLAEALIPVFPSIEPLEKGIAHYAEVFDQEFRAMMANKFGLLRYPDESDDVATDGMRLLQKAEVDMTLFFRGLADVDANAPSLAPIEHAFYSETLRTKHEPEFLAWLERYAAILRTQGEETAEARAARMNATNPHFILRNYLAQQAIELAESGDESMVLRLFAALRDPYAERPEFADLVAKRPEWAKRKAGSSMLSCSS